MANFLHDGLSFISYLCRHACLSFVFIYRRFEHGGVFFCALPYVKAGYKNKNIIIIILGSSYVKVRLETSRALVSYNDI